MAESYWTVLKNSISLSKMDIRLNHNSKLPLGLQNHVCVVYKDRLFVIGALDFIGFVSPSRSSIYEIQPTCPYTSKLLAKMPRTVDSHGVAIVNNKIYIYIFGGSEPTFVFGATNNVLMFDPVTNNFTELQLLPYAVSHMATVTWKDNVVILGGRGKEGSVLDTVILYDVTTGSHCMLPSMKKKRFGCTAIIIGNDIVVIGGSGYVYQPVNSVECYNFHTNTWTEFPAMIKPRQSATAVVKYC